jgi:hypothetical protein
MKYNVKGDTGMMKYNVVIILTISFLALLIASVNATEPQRPNVNHIFDFEKEAKINEISSLTPQEAFKRLKGIDFVTDKDLLNKSIFKTFEHRKAKGVALALGYLKLPVMEIKNGKLVDRTADFYVAKKILEVFPDKSVNKLLNLYKRGDAVTKGNVIRASGNIAGKRIRNLLIKALDDKTFCEGENPEIDGIPLRISDVAYNQLILRYKVENVRRSIGNADTIEVRDYHIGILKSKLLKQASPVEGQNSE